jgi:hypothetical protein
MNRSIEIVYRAIDAVNEQLPEENRLPKAPDVILLGKGGRLDSLGFVNLLVCLEESCDQVCGVSVSFVDAARTDEDSALFETVGTLIDHVDRVLKTKMTSEA